MSDDRPNVSSLAERVRRACLEAALRAYEEAGMAGLCHDGAWEVAVDAIRALDLDAVVRAEGDDPEG